MIYFPADKNTHSGCFIICQIRESYPSLKEIKDMGWDAAGENVSGFGQFFQNTVRNKQKKQLSALPVAVRGGLIENRIRIAPL
jgi:hypothetical protein